MLGSYPMPAHRPAARWVDLGLHSMARSYKSPNHPHTNMAKAALNMMTRTCAEELAGCGIYMNSVDTGWINDEKPIERAAAHAADHHFQTPLDEVDAAARILDPVLSAAHGGEPLYGKFLKDYVPVEW